MCSMKILIPIDQSVYSKVALQFICGRCANFGKDSHFYVIHIRPQTFLGSLFERKGIEEALEEEAMDLLNPAVKQLQDAGLQAEAIYDVGNVPQLIDDYAEKHDVDLIVMGSQGTSSVQGIIFGSVTNSLLALTYKPMLVLRDKAINFKDSPYIGLTVDGSMYSQTATDYLIKHMGFFGGKPRVYLMNVVERPAPGRDYPLEEQAREEHKENIGEIFDEAEAKLIKAGAECRKDILTGNEPGDAIAKFADKEDLDLIVIGTRGRGAIQSSLLGSTSSRIAAVSDRPLLIVQTDEDAVAKKEQKQKS